MEEISSGLSKSRRGQRFLVFLYFAAVAIGLAQALKKGGPSGEVGGAFSKIKTEPAVAVVPVTGVISTAREGFKPMSSDGLVRRLKSLSEAAEVKAVVLRINSPGGTVGAVQEIHDQVLALKKSGKKVVASMGDVAASGGYYVAAAADEIYAQPGTLTGSIGVILQVGNVQELFKKLGVRVESVKSSEHKDIASPFRPMSEKERKILQSIIDETYGQFVDAVAQGRKMDRKKALALADGRIFSGSQAKAQGLVDQMGNLEAAIAKAASLAGIQGKPRVLYEEDPFQKIFSLLAQESGARFWEASFSKFGLGLAYLWEYSP